MSADEQFKQLLQSEHDYEDHIGLFVSYFSSDEASAQKLASRIFKTINSLFTRKKLPLRYYLSARLVKDLMILDQNRFENLCAIEIIPQYNIILQKLSNSTVEAKLFEYFGDSIQNDQDRVAARKFFQVLLESVSVWGRQQGSNQIFRDNYQQLKQKNVPFPQRYEFYDNNQVQSFLDDQNDIEQNRFEEQKNQGNNGKNNNTLNNNIAKYQNFQKKLQGCVDSNRQNEKQLKNELTVLEQQIKEITESLEQDLQICITNQNQDTQMEQLLEKIFEYQSYFIELEQDIEKYKNGIFDPQRFFSKYGSKNYQGESNTNIRSNKQFENTPTPQDNNMIRNSQPPQKPAAVQQNLYNLNDDEEDGDDNFQQQIQQSKNQQQRSQQNIEQQQKSQIEQQKLIEQQLLKEQQQREQQLRDQQLQEQQMREKQQKEQQLKEQQQKEQLLKEQQQKEQKMREQQEQLLREQQKNEQLMIEQQMKEQEIAEQLMKEQQQKSQYQSQSQIQNKPQQQQSLKLSELNKMKEQQKQKQNLEQDQFENENNFAQNSEKPKISKDYFQEEEFYDPNRAAQQQEQHVFKNNRTNQFNSQSEAEPEYQNFYAQEQKDQSRVGFQSEYQEKSFKSFTNESYRNKHYQSMIVKSNSQSKFTKTINENIEKYIQPYASSKIGFNQSISNIDRTEQTKSQGPDKKKPVFSQNEKLKEIKQENANLQSKIIELQSNVKVLSNQDKNQYLVELKEQNDDNTRRIQEQNEIIKQLQESLASIQDENNKLKSQGSQLSNNLENEQLKSQISKLQHDYQELLYNQRNTQRSENQMSFPVEGNIESHPQYQALMRQNEELKSRLSQYGGSNHGSLIHNQPSMPPSSNFPLNSPGSQTRGRIDNYSSVPAGGVPSKRYQSPKIFQEFKPRGVDEQVLRQSVDSLNIQGYSSNLLGQRQQNPLNQQNLSQNTFVNNGMQQDPYNQQRYKQSSGSIYNTSQVNQSGTHQFKTTQPIFSQQPPPPPSNIIRRTFDSPQQQNYQGGMDNLVSQFNGSDQAQKQQIKREFNTPPSQQGQRIPSSGNAQINHTSPKRIFDGIGDMKDVSQIPSIIFNDKREEIESIQKNNQSTQSYNESVKEILNPLSTKNNILQDQQLVSKNPNKSKPLNFSEVKEGEEVQFDKNLFNLILQYVAKLNRFKASCLKTKYPIYEDSQVQIGVVTNHQQQNGGNYFRVQLYYSNKGSRALKNLKVTVLDEQKNYQVHVSPEIIAEIEPKQQKKQELLISYSYMPFNPCFISINYSGVSPLYLGLPNTVNKMFVYKDINKDLFKRQFKERKYIKYITIPECNPKFAKTHQDFKMYLEKLVDLNPESEFDHIQGTSKFKMGLQFSLDQYSNERNPQDYLMKIVCNPDQSAHIFIAFNDYNSNEKVEFILNTFCFLFSSNKND